MTDAHRDFSARCFSACWELIERSDRTDSEVEDMRLLAYASLWHWKQRDDCTDENLCVGYWQVSRVEALAGYGAVARDFALKSLAAAHSAALAPFFRGYALEALARSAAALGDRVVASEQIEAARAELSRVEDPEAADMLRADLDQLACRLEAG
ncbi:MAG: hypothetical protein GX446_15980 [Chthonomonadales bacterium]|nr:hypothetical protein [Chthonomonadales bacterium]